MTLLQYIEHKAGCAKLRCDIYRCTCGVEELRARAPMQRMYERGSVCERCHGSRKQDAVADAVEAVILGLDGAEIVTRKRASTFVMSFFNTEMICFQCDEAERAHPLYDEARAAELRETLAGNYNYEGIGCPPELRAHEAQQP